MSAEAIPDATFIREFTRELHNKNAAVFAGAGLSTASGYVDWKGLLREIIQDLGLDPNKEHDLVTLAQYHCNQVVLFVRVQTKVLNDFPEQTFPINVA